MRIPRIIRGRIEKIIEHIFVGGDEWVTQNRPHFGPHQVRTPAGIKPGNILIRVTRHSRDRIVVRSEPYPNPGTGLPVGPTGDLIFDYVYEGQHLWWSRLLSDCGVVPYKGGGWSPTNHLLRTGRRRLTAEEMRPK